MAEGTSLHLLPDDSKRGRFRASLIHPQRARRAAWALLLPLTALWLAPSQWHSLAAEQRGPAPQKAVQVGPGSAPAKAGPRVAPASARQRQAATTDQGQRTKDKARLAARRLSRPSLLETYGRLPLSFEPNEGQTDPRVKFLSRGQGYTLFLTEDGAVLALRRQKAESSR